MDDASATDNCGEVTIDVVDTTIAGACAGNYTISRLFTATDDCGNSTSATQTITIIDTTAPVLTIPSDYTAECTDELTLIEATVTDNCSACYVRSPFTSSEDAYGIEVVEVASHTEGSLSGLTTYRIYLTAPSGLDQVTSFTGNDEFPLSINTSTSFFQHALGGATPSNITPGAIDLIPELAFDSWVTLGISQSPVGDQSPVELIPGSWSTEFENGNGFNVNDGIGSGWYVIPSASNGIVGDDNRLLVAQLTTDGLISASLRAQIFPDGDQVNDVRADLTLDQYLDCSELSLDLVETVVEGCGDTYVLSRTWTSVDDCGNSSLSHLITQLNVQTSILWMMLLLRITVVR